MSLNGRKQPTKKIQNKGNKGEKVIALTRATSLLRVTTLRSVTGVRPMEGAFKRSRT